MSLQIKDLSAGYGQAEVLHDVSLDLESGNFGAVLGPNGAGKTTLLLSLMGFVDLHKGEVLFEGESLRNQKAHKLVHRGIGFVSEQDNLFPNMTVRENLLMGAHVAGRHQVQDRLTTVFELFPWLEERGGQSAGTLSGGQRKMLALARALMSRPRLLLVDEPSNGLAPTIVTTVFDALRELRKQGLTVLLVEQHIKQALALSDWAWVMEGGKIRLQGSSADVSVNPYVKEAYLGV